MTRISPALLLVLALFGTMIGFLAEPARGDTGGAAADAPDSVEARPVVLPVIEVRAQRIDTVLTDVLSMEGARSARHTNLSESVLELSGVAGVRRNASYVEPVIRGLGQERVSVQRDHLPVFGACPGRMDPPLAYASSETATEILIVKGLPSVTLGPAGTGGRIVLRSPRVPSGAAPGLDAWARAGYEAARAGRVGAVGGRFVRGDLDLEGSIEALDYGDYESGDGVEVPAQQQAWGVDLRGVGRIGASTHWWASASLEDEQGADYPSLPMDMRSSRNLTLSTGVSATEASPWQVEFGLFDIDHEMDNRDKPNRSMLEAETTSTSNGVSAMARYDREFGPDQVVRIGGDGMIHSRDALRTRRLTGPGTVFQDHIWPDAHQSTVGVFGEWESRTSSRWSWRAGVRGDLVDSRADAADEAGLGGRTIAESWVFFSGEDAADHDRSEVLLSGNVVLSTSWSPSVRAHFGAGLSSRAAGVTERYYALAPAPGGFQIGNPGLDAEQKREWSVEFEVDTRSIDLSLGAYLHDVADFVLPTTLAFVDVNGDGTPDRLRGFENVDARLWGFDGEARVRLGGGWSLPLQASWVRGENSRDDRPLPEIPAPELGIGVRYASRGAHPYTASLTSRLVDEQNRVDTRFGEDRSAGFVTLDLAGTARFSEGVWLDLGVRNLLDKAYHEHLTREAVLPVGDLAAGDEVPAPGRTVYATVRYEFGR